MMAHRMAALVLGLAGLLFVAPGQAEEGAPPARTMQLAQADNGFDKVVFLLDFADYREGSVEAWLRAKGFVFERDAQNRRKIDLDVAEASLILEAKSSAHGLLIDESVDVQSYSRIRIEWGVTLYPEGASYENDARSEAVMVLVFFGYDKISSGSMLIPNSPYFLGLFLCAEDRVGHPYVGRYFQKGGRYICLDKPAPGEAVVSELDLVKAFKTNFEPDEVPVISGLALAVDTSNAKGDGRSLAFIRSIKFLE